MSDTEDLEKLDYLLNANEVSDSDESVSSGDIENDVANLINEDYDDDDSVVSDEELSKDIAPFSSDAKRVIPACRDVNVRKAMMLNQQKKLELMNQAEKLNGLLAKVREKIQELKKEMNVPAEKKVRGQYCRLGIPYFKDVNMFPCPSNPDYAKKKENGELMLYEYDDQKRWTRSDRSRLLVGVKQYIFNVRKEELQRRSVELQAARNASDDPEFKREVTVKLNEMVREVQRLATDDNALNTFVSAWTGTIDWMSISNNAVRGRHTDTECEACWAMYLNPKLNKKPWSEHEDNCLKHIVKAHNMENWESIATQLNTGRSALQCCERYFSAVHDNRNKGKWLPEEDNYLLNIIEYCKIGNHIPWTRVSSYFPHKSKLQIYQHYRHVLCPNLRKGRFTLAEDVFMTAVYLKYNDIDKLHFYFPHRSRKQLLSHFSFLYFNHPTSVTGAFSVEDDKAIVDHVEQFGSTNWGAVTSRHPHVVRRRYELLKKWMQENPDRPLSEAPRRSRKRYFAARKKYRAKVLTLAMDIQKFEKDKRDWVLSFPAVRSVLDDRRHLRYREKTKADDKVDYALTQFFKSSYKYVGRQSIVLSEKEAQTAAIKIGNILNCLGASLQIPNAKELEAHESLDNVDRAILKYLPSTSTETEKLIPPHAWNVIGFRALLLHQSQLSRSVSVINSRLKQLYKEKGMDVDAMVENAVNTIHPMSEYRGGYYPKYLICKLNEQLDELDFVERQNFIRRMDIFRKRFRCIFQWPALMSMPSCAPANYENIFDSKPEPRPKPVKKSATYKREMQKAKVKAMIEGRKKKMLERASTSREDLEQGGSDESPVRIELRCEEKRGQTVLNFNVKPVSSLQPSKKIKLLEESDSD